MNIIRKNNIKALLDASAFINTITKETYDALFDYYIDNGSLDTINVDNDIINNIVEYTKEELINCYSEKDLAEGNISLLVEAPEKNLFVVWY